MIALASIGDPAIVGSFVGGDNHLSCKNSEMLFGHSQCSMDYLNCQDYSYRKNRLAWSGMLNGWGPTKH